MKFIAVGVRFLKDILLYILGVLVAGDKTKFCSQILSLRGGFT